MIKERVLEVGIDEAIALFEIHRWKFYEIDSEEGILKIEVPRGYTEAYIIEFQFSNESQCRELVNQLAENGFIKQTIRTKGSF